MKNFYDVGKKVKGQKIIRKFFATFCKQKVIFMKEKNLYTKISLKANLVIFLKQKIPHKGDTDSLVVCI